MQSSIEQVYTFGKSKGACAEAMRWLKEQNDPEHAWLTCERSDWMIWYAARRGVDRKVLVRIACDCARTALRFVPEDEDRPRLCIETTERWIVGEATIEEVRTARDAAAYAAYAGAYAAYAAAAAYAAYAGAAGAAAYAAYAAYAAAARHQANIQMCGIVRKYISYQDIAIS